MKTCACGREAREGKLGLCQRCYLAQWKRTPHGKAMIAANRLRHSEKINSKRRAERATQPGVHSGKVKEYHHRLRAQLISALGGKCACCGEDELIFLQLDHIHGGGARHYKHVGSWSGVYRAVRDLGFPPDQFRPLCSNCNSAIGRYGRCPHELQRMADAMLSA